MIAAVLILVAVVFAVNIGASAASATMSQVYGGGVLSKRRTLVLVGLFALVGAVVAGSYVAHTVGEGIVTGDVIDAEIALVILLAALFPLFVANLIGIPLSTSEVTVGSVVGVGLALGGLDLTMVMVIVLSWALLPAAAFMLSALLQWIIGHPLEHYLEAREGGWLQRVLGILLVGSGCYAAFSAGANNAANAVGPLIGAGVLSSTPALLLGGVALGIGAIGLGGRVLETSGRRLTLLTLPGGITVSFTTASLILVLSLLGVPAPLTQATTGGILGVGFAHRGIGVLQRDIVKKVASGWLLSPAVSMVLAYFLVNFLQGLEGDFAGLAMVMIAGGVLVLASIIVRAGPGGIRRAGERAFGVVASMGVHHPKRDHLAREIDEATATGSLVRHRHEDQVEVEAD